MIRTAAILVILCATVFTLIVGKELLIPFVFAILVWLLMRKIRDGLDYIPFVKKYVPFWIKTLLSSAFFISVFILLGRMIQTNIYELIASVPSNSLHYKKLIGELQHYIPVSLDELKNDADLNETIRYYLSSLVDSLTTVVGNLFLILLYVLFILLEESSFRLKLVKLFPKFTHYERSKLIFDNIERSVSNYIGLKSFLALISATVCGVMLLIFEVHAPVFWALMIFVLYFIPTIGMVISSALPALFTFITTGDGYFALSIFFTLGVIQGIVNNILETKLMSNSLNVSPLVTIFALVFWGAIWGLTGMFLSVPITVILVLVFSHFPATRSVAILLSEKGEIRQN